MKQVFAIVLALVLSAGAGAEPIQLTDDAGRPVILAAPAERIVSLAPHITELLFSAGAGGRIVGAVSYSDYPPPARDIPRVGSFQQLDYEQILALQPDLVVGWQSGNPAEALAHLRRLGLALYLSEPSELEDIPASIENLGALAGTGSVADRAAARFRGELEKLRRRYAGREPVTLFYQLWHDPVMTLSGDHLFSDVARLCGGRNIFADLPTLAPTVDVEAVLERNPQVILASGQQEGRPEWLDAWRNWPSLRAVREDHLYHIPPDYLQRHTVRVLEGAMQLCEYLEKARSD